MANIANKAVLEERGIKESDVDEILKSDCKLVNSDGTELYKAILGDVTYYAVVKDGAVQSAYTHKMSVGDIVNIQADSEWTCAKCNEPAKAGTVDVSYMGTTRSGPGLLCPKCKETYLEEYLAVGTIAFAEGLFEKKRA